MIAEVADRRSFACPAPVGRGRLRRVPRGRAPTTTTREVRMSHNRLRRLALVVVALLGFSTSAARAGFIFQTQSREVSGTVGVAGLGGNQQRISAPSFGLFDATTNVTFPTYGGVANQHQRSELLPDLITVIGDTICVR